MIKNLICALAMAGAVATGAHAADKGLDPAQPPDPQPAGGPIGDGENWEGDGGAPVVEPVPGSGTKDQSVVSPQDARQGKVKPPKAAAKGTGTDTRAR